MNITKNNEMIKFREIQLEVSNHASERLEERFGNVNLQDAIGRGKTLNMQNVAKYPWLRKKLMGMIGDTNIQLIVNPFHNMQVVIDKVTKVVITIEFLDARGTGYEYNYAG